VQFSRRVVWCCPIVLMLGLATDVHGQVTAGPISRFVVDARGSLARFKQDSGVSQPLGVDASTLPTRGLGITVGAHLYPLRARRVTFGVGVEYARAGDSKTTTITDQQTNEEVEGPTLTTRFTSFAPQLSINFGRDEGWSYLSAGIGRARITTENEAQPVTDTADSTQVINYGGGARWFNSPRMAFTFDIRWYAISPREATTTVPGYPRAKFMVLSAGLAFR
jgi:outer membrane protein with beta-barrel domain